MRPRPAVPAALGCLVVCGAAAAQTVTLGSPLPAGLVPNTNITCAAKPELIPDASGEYQVVPSGTADCSWRQSGVFGSPNDPRFSSVPGDGRIVAVTIRSGPAPAPLHVVVMRQLSTPGFGAVSQCCFFVTETPPLPIAANQTQTFAVDIPVVRNTIDGFLAVDLVGFSAAGGGTLPLAVVGPTNAFGLTSPGSVNAGFFYPRMGAIGADSGGGRREDGIPGIEVLMNFTWCPAAAGGAGPGVCGGAGGGGGAAVGPALRNANAAVAAGRRALLDLVCNGNAACRGVLELLAAGSGAVANASDRGTPRVVAAAAKASRYGRRKFRIAAGANVTLGVPLTGRARKLLKRQGSLLATVRIAPKGGAPVDAGVTLRR